MLEQRPASTASAASRPRAFRHATGAEGLAIIDGLAGTGKSHTTAPCAKPTKRPGYRVIGLA